MQKIQKMTKNAMDFCQLELKHPNKTILELCAMAGISENTAYTWSRSECYREYRANLLKEEWKAASKSAQKKMIELIESKNQSVAYKASSYVLDSNGYKAPEQVELKSDTITINIDKEDK